MKTKLYMLQEQNKGQMMSYIVQTENGKLIVIDGGDRANGKHLKDMLFQLGGSKPCVDLWLLTHPHTDHIDALLEILEDPGMLHIEKIYEFTLLGDLTEDKRAALEGGVLLPGDPEPTHPAVITVTGKSTLAEVLPTLHPEIQEKTRHNPMDRAVTFGTITLTEGRNRQIRRMMKTQRLLVLALKRVKMGPYTLPDRLAPGQWIEVQGL